MLFKNITIIDENFDVQHNCYVAVKDGKIASITSEKPEGDFGREYDGFGKALLPGFVNTHAHSPMTLLRGYAENMALQDWLTKQIFPFEDQLDGEAIYWGTLLAMAESLQSGIVSTTDMYYFTDEMVKAYNDSGSKGNISRSITCFSDQDLMDMTSGKEMVEAYEKYHNTSNGRILIDMSMHAEYTNTDKSVRQLAEYTKKIGVNQHVHVSETKLEHEECKQRHGGLTPVAYLAEHGIFDSPTTAAHCVWLEESDYAILKDKGVTVAVNPISNMKLASGVCNVQALLDHGVNVAIGTDSVSSNNSLNFLNEMKTFAIAGKMYFQDPKRITPKETLYAATRGGALAQGRSDCGLIKEGFCADLVVLNLENPNMHPVHNLLNNIVYSAGKENVLLTMVDGEVLYEDGICTKFDVKEAIKGVDASTQRVLDRLK